jgi:glycosyltransferase involved in cell wall biosynthesis
LAIADGEPCDVLSFGKLAVENNPFPLDRMHLLECNSAFGFGYSSKLRAWLRRNLSRYRGVVLHGMWMYPILVTAYECRALGVPYACFPHGMLDVWPVRGQGLVKRAKKTIYWYLFEKKIVEGAAVIFFTAEREKLRAGQVFKFKNEQRLLIPYGIRSGIPTGPETSMVLDPKIRNRRVALYLSRVHPKKNVDFLVRAWAAAKPPDEWLLVIAGSGPADYLCKVKKLIENLGVAKSVIMVGHVQGLLKEALLDCAEWFLLPSSHENFGVAVVEALSSGCAVAISDEVYFADFLPEDACVLPLDLEIWAGFMKDRMCDDVFSRNRREADRKVAFEKLRFSTVAKDWADAMERAFPSAER